MAKIAGEAYAVIRADMATVFNSLPRGTKVAAREGKLGTVSALAWNVWNRVTDDRRQDDTHPRFTSRGDARLLPYVGIGFELYPCGSNDQTLGTAIIKAMKQILTELE